jgi:F0F1-type ATP synthase assembly protein I
MKQTTAPKNPSAVFVDMAMGMSWRLAFVVILPIVAGFKVDAHFDTSPLGTITGFLLALVGMVLVLRRMLKEVAGQDFSTPDVHADVTASVTKHRKFATTGKAKGHRS